MMAYALCFVFMQCVASHNDEGVPRHFLFGVGGVLSI